MSLVQGAAGPEQPQAPCRLFVYLAREAPIGVVLRRGPSAWARLSVWHTNTDSFEHGQWFKGRVYERRSDVSADGSLFVYFAFHPYGGPYIVEYAVRAEHQGAVIPLGQATWADWDQQGRLVIAQQGRLLHWQPTGTPRELADFNPQTPAPAASPPRARTWPRPPRER